MLNSKTTSALSWLSRLLPPALRKREVLPPDKRRELWATVSEHDNCLRAVLDRLQETLEGEFHIAIDPTRTDVEKLRALEGLRVCYYQLRMIDEERAAALEWKRENQN